MSKLARLVSPLVSSVLTSPKTRDTRRWIAERMRRVRKDRHRVLYFHQVDDPYSQLAVQVLPQFVARYEVDIEPYLVAPPPDEAAPDRARLIEFSRKDAADVASAYGLEFESQWRQPEPAFRELVLRLLACAIRNDVFVDRAAAIGRAMWTGDAAEVDRAAGGLASFDLEAAGVVLAEGTALRAKLRHYLGGMFYYAGEWYWGVDRLSHLERRLCAAGAVRRGQEAAVETPIVPRPTSSALDAADIACERVQLEFYPSLRSPYSYIAMERVFALAARLPVDLVLRPVLPMVMRGMAVPSNKRIYIMLDTKREADDAGVPFGKICDPVGRPVERAFALYPWAREQGRAAEYILSFARAVFAEGIDAGNDRGLRRVVERAGLSWGEAQAHRDSEGWRAELESNRDAMLGFGLWGVPSFRIVAASGQRDFCTWGQDRIWLVEREIRRRCGLPA
jgi:2-hydroxychromene-2-carboxylate isomerase